MSIQAMTVRGRWWRGALALAATAVVLGGCVYAPPPPPPPGYAYAYPYAYPPGYYPAPAYYGPPVFGSVFIGGRFR